MNEYVPRVPAVDPLTGMASSAALRVRMDQVERECAPHGFGLVLVNIRGLSAYNQEHGYHAGDELIRAVARRLQDCSTSSAGEEYGSEVDCLARTGGGEFSLLVRSRGGELSQFRRWLRMTLEYQPVLVAGREQAVEFSTSFRNWIPAETRDLLWRVQDAHRHLGAAQHGDPPGRPREDDGSLRARRRGRCRATGSDCSARNRSPARTPTATGRSAGPASMRS